MQQITNTVLMVRPANFRANPETQINNYYQSNTTDVLPQTLQQKALKEFNNYVLKLKSLDIQVIVVEDQEALNLPDAVFPNNWITFHENGTLAMYPMFAKNRRLERRTDILDIIESHGFVINDILDYTDAENEAVFLEGTGSMVLDRENRKAYCAISPRTNEDLFIEFCEDFEYTPVIFYANQTIKNQRKPIYHTNVMLSIAKTFAIACLEAIDDKKERKNLVKHLKNDGKAIINITEAQLASFVGNVIQLKNSKQESFLIMSTKAYNTLTPAQLSVINKHTKIESINIDTIETYGGGSVRCMLAEIFLPRS